MGDRFHSQIVWTQSVIVVTLAIFLCPAYGIPQDYLARRQAFVQAEDSMRIGAELKLNFREGLVNHYLMLQKDLAVEASRLTKKPYLASRHFFQVKEEIEKTSIFDIIRMMPKGGNLHLHDATIVPLDWVVKNLTYLPDLYTKERDGETPRLFNFSSTPLSAEDGWHEVAKLRAEMEKQSPTCSNNWTPTHQSLDQVFMSELSLYTPDPYNTYKSANDIWAKFNNFFRTFLSLRSNLAVAEYGEVDSNGVDLTDDYLSMIDRVVKQYQVTHPDFLGIKFIMSGHRHYTEQEMQQAVKLVAERMKKFPDLVKGFDIDAHEDTGHRNQFYLNELIKDGQSALPFMFHAGETSWNQAADMNLVDAVLLNATRIGHGFAALKHPKVMEAIRAQGIVIEVQPVSNQVLGFVNDLRAHPATSLIANNDRITISSDNFPLWGALPLSHDFYMAFMGLGSTKDDLRLLKQLAMNSIKFSTMSEREKNFAMRAWQQRWTTFIDDVITKYHLL